MKQTNLAGFIRMNCNSIEYVSNESCIKCYYIIKIGKEWHSYILDNDSIRQVCIRDTKKEVKQFIKYGI